MKPTSWFILGDFAIIVDWELTALAAWGKDATITMTVRSWVALRPWIVPLFAAAVAWLYTHLFMEK
jgi:hypothetical protein